MSFVYCENCGDENKDASRACLCGSNRFSTTPVYRIPREELHFRADDVIQALRCSPNMSYKFIGVMTGVPSAEVEMLARQAGLA